LECHQPPGCACNRMEDFCYLQAPEPTPSPSPTPDPCALSVERSLSSADPAFYIASCPISPNPIDCYLTAIALIQQGVLIADPTSAYPTEAALIEFFESQVQDLENNPQPTPSPSSAPSPDPFPSPCPAFTSTPTPEPTPTPCQRPSYPDYCLGYWSNDGADITTLDPPICELPELPPQLECYTHSENQDRAKCYYKPEQGCTSLDSHHIVQEAAVRGILGYLPGVTPGSNSRVKNNSAPTVLLPGPANRRGCPHYLATQAQRRPNTNPTYGDFQIELDIAQFALVQAGLSGSEVNYQLASCAGQFFNQVDYCVLPPTPTCGPGNRRGVPRGSNRCPFPSTDPPTKDLFCTVRP
jgi:hypothetical protein